MILVDVVCSGKYINICLFFSKHVTSCRQLLNILITESKLRNPDDYRNFPIIKKVEILLLK